MKLDHAQLAMPSGKESEARAFFVGLLEMEEEEKPEPLASRGGCWFRSGTVVLHLGVDESFRAQTKAHLAFCVADLKGLERRLVAGGYPVRWDESLEDRERFYTTDPFGSRIEFMAEGSGFSDR